MKNDMVNRRTFLKGAVASSAAAVIGTPSQPARAQGAPAPAQQRAPPPVQRASLGLSPTSAVYACLNLEEQAFVEALVDHMVLADRCWSSQTWAGVGLPG